MKTFIKAAFVAAASLGAAALVAVPHALVTMQTYEPLSDSDDDATP